MVVDTWALTAIILGEPEEQAFIFALAAAPTVHISAATLVNLNFVLISQLGSQAENEIEQLLARLQVEVVPFARTQASAAVAAFRRYGKGRDPARLNLGDCYSYALAKTRNA